MKPKEISLLAINIKIDSQIRIFQAPVWFKASFIVKTPVNSNKPTAKKATKVESN